MLNQNLLNSALLIGTVIFTLLAMEVGLRAYIALQLYQAGSSIRSVYQYQFTNFRNQHAETNVLGAYDPELGWVPRLLKDGIRSNGSGNAGTEVWDAAEDILAIGDSFTFGAQVSDWETWPARLEKLSGTRVVNAGVNGYGIDQAFLRAQRLLSRYRFRTVIFSFIPDDIRRCQMSVFAAAKPYFEFRDGRLRLENVPVPPPSPPKESRLLILLEHSQLVHSVMRRWFGHWWLRLHEIKVQDEVQGRVVACALLHQLEGLTKSRGSELILLIQHAKGEGLSESMAVEIMLSCLSDPATRVLDLKPELSELKAKDPPRYDRLYYPIDGHMTAEGNQFVALEIFKVLTQRLTKTDRGVLSPKR